jgi:hypothetical protein
MLVLARIFSLKVSVVPTGRAVIGTGLPPVLCRLPLCSRYDCALISNDSDATIYPGRATTQYGPEIDHNCNGIYGVDTDVRPLNPCLLWYGAAFVCANRKLLPAGYAI